MLDMLLARWKQGRRTMRYPAGPPPELPDRFVGRPIIDPAKCASDCGKCVAACPTGAISLLKKGTGSEPSREDAARDNGREVPVPFLPISLLKKGTGSEPSREDAARDNGREVPVPFLQLDTGRCLFCRDCETACSGGAIAFSREYRMAASKREDLVVADAARRAAIALDETTRRLFGRSLKLRQVSAGGCNACEADTNVLGTVAWDLSRFGIQFVASPRHADGLLITGPVPENMRLALQKTYAAVPWPKLVIAVGACAIAGGPYIDHAEVHNGATNLLPVDLFIPGCPPHPLTILDGLLTLLGRGESDA